MYHPVSVTLSHAQFKKMRAGHPVQLSHSQIAGPQRHQLMLHPVSAKKVAGAIRKFKGVRLQVSPHEFEASGEGLMDFFNKIKQGAQWLKSNVIDTPFYQKNIRPIAKDLVQTGIQTFVPAPAREYAQKAAEFGSEKTGAFGLKGTRGRPRKSIPRSEHMMIRQEAFTPVAPMHYMPYKPRLQSGMQTMLSASHPAMWPSEPYLPDIGGRVKSQRAPAMPRGRKSTRGRKPGSGSFKLA